MMLWVRLRRGCVPDEGAEAEGWDSGFDCVSDACESDATELNCSVVVNCALEKARESSGSTTRMVLAILFAVVLGPLVEL